MTLRLALPLCLALGLPAQALELDAMSDAERAAFQAEVKAYILENPEIITEAIGVLQQRKDAAETLRDRALAQANADALFNDGHSFVGGNPEGDITVVEFMDYRCGYCKRAQPEVAALLSADPNIRYVVKELPILGEASVLAARYAIATKLVAGDDAYHDVHNTLMEFRGDITDITLRRLGETLGLDNGAITAAMNSDEVNNIMTENRELALAMQITGTPTFVFEDQMMRGYAPLAQMQQIVADLREGS